MRLRIPKKYAVLLFGGVLLAAIGASLPLGSLKWVTENLPLHVGVGVDYISDTVSSLKTEPEDLGQPSEKSNFRAEYRDEKSGLQAVAIAISIFMITLVGVVYVIRYFRLRRFADQQIKIVERKEKIARSLLDLVADPVILVSAGGLIETCNPAAEALLGYRESELVGREFTILLSDSALTNAPFKQAAAFAAVSSEARGKLVRIMARHKDGLVFPIEVNVSRAEIDGIVVYGGTIRVISDSQATPMETGQTETGFVDAAPSPINDLTSKLGVKTNVYGDSRFLPKGTQSSTVVTKSVSAQVNQIDPVGPSEPKPAATIPSLRVLLAEDHPINQQLTSIRLRELGCTVDVVETGTQAVNAVRQSVYDLILMDVRMPDMDGIQATKEIRAVKGLENGPPIIVVTADGSGSTRTRCLDAGANCLLSKPVSRAKLRETLSNYLDITIKLDFYDAAIEDARDLFTSDLVRFETPAVSKKESIESLSELIDDIENLEQTII